MAAGGKAGRPRQRDALAGADPITDSDPDPGQMRVLADDVFALVTAMVDDDQIAVATVPAGLDDPPSVGGHHHRAAGGAHVDPVVHPPVMQDRMEPLPERPGDRTRHRRNETAAVRGHPGDWCRRRHGVVVVQPVTGRAAVECGRRHVGPVTLLLECHRTGNGDRTGHGDRIGPRHRLGHRRPAQRRDQQHRDSDRHCVQHVRAQRQAMVHPTARTPMTSRWCRFIDSPRWLAVVARVVGWWRGHVPPNVPRYQSAEPNKDAVGTHRHSVVPKVFSPELQRFCR